MYDPGGNYHFFRNPELSEWQCHLFGSNGNGISWRPNKGQEPNRFWRLMQYLLFGNHWVKDPPPASPTDV